MNLQELKTSIEGRAFKPSPIVLVDENKFISLQYIEEIRNNICPNIIYIESLDELSESEDIFSSPTKNFNDDFVVLITELVDFSDKLVYNNNVLVVTKKISKSSKDYYKDIIIEVPELLDWQIKDLAYSMGRGINSKYLDKLLSICGKDIYRLYNELLKIKIFNEKDRQFIFQDMCKDGALSDISNSTIFNFTNAIMKRDISDITSIYEEIDTIDINEFGLLTILYNNFLNVVNIQLGINPTAEKLGMKPNQFNAIRYNCGKYTNAQLISILKFLTEIDCKIKKGELDTKSLIDYMIVTILSI